MHFDQNIVLIVAAAVFGISRLIARIAENAREQPRRGDTPAGPQAQEKRRPLVLSAPKTDEERVREFLEALGAPKGAMPPPKVQPCTDIPPRPVAPISLPPLPFSPEVLRPVVQRTRKIFAPPPAATPPASAPSPAADEPGEWLREADKVLGVAANFEAATRATAESEAKPAVAMEWRNALRSRESVRAALVLREILGPPRALSEAGRI